MKKTTRAMVSRLFLHTGMGRARFAMTLLCAGIAGIAAVLSTLYIGRCIGAMVGQGRVDFQLLGKELLALGITYALVPLAQFIEALLSNRIAHATANVLRDTLFAHMNNLPLKYYDRRAHGDIISRFTNDCDAISDALALSIVSLLSGAVTIVASLAVMLYLSVPITLLVLASTSLSVVVALKVTKMTKGVFAKQQRIVGEVSGYIAQIVGNQRAVIAFGREEKERRDFASINQELFVVGVKAQFASASVNPVTRFVDNISYLLVGVVGGLIAIATGAPIATISSFLIYSGQFAKPFNEVSGIMHQIQSAVAATQRVFEVIDEAADPWEADAQRRQDIQPGTVSFDNVSFAYEEGQPLLEQVDFRVDAGQLVAIVGPTGAGKTTIVNLLMGFYKVDAGAIKVGAQDIQSFTVDALRRSFGMVLQETWLFTGTVRDNLKYAKPEATDEEMMQAAKRAHAHSFIKRMEHGYDTMIEGSGARLSEGQKQLLTIARVMLADPSMLILDEATSSLDVLTEMQVQEGFGRMMQGRTSFVIAHRLSTIVAADMIMVMKQGQIVETGTHEELLGAGGVYTELYRSQFA